VKQVAVTLLSSSLKLTHTAIPWAVSLGADEPAALMIRQRTGIGIAPENHGKISEDLRQVDDSLATHGGTGVMWPSADGWRTRSAQIAPPRRRGRARRS
jgi:hypothetical protein